MDLKDRLRLELYLQSLKASQRDKGPLEDLILLSELPHARVLLVADGATGASGLRAVTVLRDTYHAIVTPTNPTKEEAFKDLFATFVEHTYRRLTEEANALTRPLATTLVACAITTFPDDPPKVMLSRLGDSGFIVTHEYTDEIPVALSRGSDYGHTPWLHSGVPRQENVRWDNIVLYTPGLYRVRLFTDGAHLQYDVESGEPNERYTEDVMIASRKDIRGFVLEVEEWKHRADNKWVGNDDLTIAGFDITILSESDAETNASHTQ